MEISLTTYYFGRRSVIFSKSLNTIPYWSMSESQKQIKMRGPATLSHCSHSDSFYGQNVNASYIIIILGAALSRWYGIQVTCPKNCIVTESAQTWPRDANLLRSKNLEILSFALSTWMPMLPTPPPPPPHLQIEPVPKSWQANGLGHYIKSYMEYIPSNFVYIIEIIFVSD